LAVRIEYDSLLLQQREKVEIELQKIQKRVDEFSDYGELEMMKQYVDDVKNLQKRLVEAEKLIEWIRNEETQFKMERSEYPVVDLIKFNLDPYAKLFNNVLRWQRNEKKWTDGSFTDLNAEVIVNELVEFKTELNKITKQFKNLIKKKKTALANKIAEKKRAKSNLKN
jgi:hypothetical protein